MGIDHRQLLQLLPDLQYSRGIHLLEDCEGTFIWTPAGTGGDDVHAFATKAAFFGTNGMDLQTRTTTATDGDLLSVKRYIGASISGLMIARGMVCFPDVSTVQAFRVMLRLTDQTDIWEAKFAVAPNTPQAGYYNAAGVFTAVSTWAVAIADGYWVQWELIVDTLEMNYISAMWSGVEKSIAGIHLPDQGNSSSREAAIELEVEAAGAAAAEVYCDAIYVGEYDVA